MAQIGHPAMPAGLDGFPTGAEMVRRIRAVRMDKARQTGDQPGKGELRRAFLNEAVARSRAGAASPTPFVERLVRFWSNHFTVSAARPVAAPLRG